MAMKPVTTASRIAELNFDYLNDPNVWLVPTTRKRMRIANRGPTAHGIDSRTGHLLLHSADMELKTRRHQETARGKSA